MPKTHSKSTKAAVLAALLEGQSINSVAAKYQLSPNTVRAWKRQLPLRVDSEGEKTLVEIGKLTVEYLAASLRSLRIQAELFSDKAWLEKQPASDLAVLHGVTTDKAVRLLEALEAGRESSEELDRGAASDLSPASTTENPA